MAVPVRRARQGFWRRPHTRSAWWALALAIAAPILQMLAYLAIAAGLETSDFSPWVLIPLGLALISGLAALIVGGISIIRGERSVVAFLAIGVGLAFFASFVLRIPPPPNPSA